MTLGTDLHVDVRGAGETVLCVHASFGDGTQDWVAPWPPTDWYRMLPLDRLAQAGIPTLVVSGDWEARPIPPGNGRPGLYCDVLEQRLAAQRAVIQGAGHAVQFTGKPFNERLATFLASCSRA